MKKICDIKEIYKILIIYFITTITSMILAGLLVRYEYIPIFSRNYLWVLIAFTLLFLILIRLFKVKFKSVLIFLGIIMFLLIFLLINIDFFISIGSTPDEGIFPIMSFIALYTTLPFQSIINVLVGYDIGHLSYIILPTYMVAISLFSYIILNFKGKD